MLEYIINKPALRSEFKVTHQARPLYIVYIWEWTQEHQNERPLMIVGPGMVKTYFHINFIHVIH